MDVIIYPSKDLEGSVEIPTSKSQTLRALIQAMIAKGVSVIKNALDSEDVETMISIIKSFGCRVLIKGADLVVHSPGLKKLQAPKTCFVKNSGITLRFVAALSAYFPQKITFIGTTSLNEQRSIKDLEWGLNQLGVKTSSSRGYAPFSVQGPLRKRRALISGHDSQPVSALLWLLSQKKRRQTLYVKRPQELPWIELTISWLGIKKNLISKCHYKKFKVSKKRVLRPFIYTVPKDFSSASFIIAAALFKGKRVLIKDLNFKDLQGDKGIIYKLQSWGSNFKFLKNGLEIRQVSSLNISKIDCLPFIDAFPVLTTLSCLSTDQVLIEGAAGARGKESDRVKSMTNNLKAVGLTVKEDHDCLCVLPSKIQSGVCESNNDHRIAMACSLLGLISEGPVRVKNAECVDKTYPRFFEHLKQLGVHLEIL